MKMLGRSYGSFGEVGYKEGYIVELSESELSQLTSLARVLSGKSSNVSVLLTPLGEVDLTQALKAITAFAEIKETVNDLQDILKRLDESLIPNAH